MHGPVWRKHITLTASNSISIGFGRFYTNAAFYLLSGTGSGAVKVSIKGAGGQNFVPVETGRYDLSAGEPAQKINDAPIWGVNLKSSGTAATVIMLINAWNPAG